MPKIIPGHTLLTFPHGQSVLRILQAALDAADPAQAVWRAVQRNGQQLFVDGAVYDLSRFRSVRLLSIGKAAGSLASALEALLDGFLAQGLVVTKNADPAPLRLCTVLRGSHPIPDERSLAAGRAVSHFLGQTGPDDLLICAISGGASALVTLPHAPLTLATLQTLTSHLLACGANIEEINTLRRHLDGLKGGGFLGQTQATVLSLILSDVVGGSLAAVASGPTAPDPSTRVDALQILRKYNLLDEQLSAQLLAVLKSAPETIKPNHKRLRNVHNLMIGSNRLALDAALRQAADEGLTPHLLRADLAGEARDAAVELCGVLCAEHVQPLVRPFCMVAGGETTVILRGNGYGGRNTELALAAVPALAGLPNTLLITLATDGEDGPTDAAGAIVSGETLQRAQSLGLNVAAHLANNDSYSFFAALNDLVKTGPTGTNVNDLVFLFGF